MSLKEAINNEIIDSKASDADLREQAWRTVWSAIIRDRFGLVREQDARNVSMALDDLLELGEIDDKAAAIELLSAEAGRMVRFRIDQLVHEGVDEQRKNAMNTYRTFQNFAQKMEWSLRRWSLAFRTRDPGFGERQWTLSEKYKSIFGDDGALSIDNESQASLDAIVQRELDQVRDVAAAYAPKPELLAQIDDVNLMRPNYRDRELYGDQIAGNAESLAIRSREHVITDRQLRISRLRSDEIVNYEGESPTIMKLISAEARRLSVDDPVIDRRVRSVSDYQHDRPESEWSVVKKLDAAKYQRFQEAVAEEVDKLTSEIARLTNEIAELQVTMKSAEAYAEVHERGDDGPNTDEQAKRTTLATKTRPKKQVGA